MSTLLDSDWLIDFLGGEPSAHALISPMMAGGIAISVVTYMEVYDGIERSTTPHEEERAFRGFLRVARVLPVNRTIARRAARVRAHLRSRGRPVRRGALDLVIAATALTHDLMLVSRNAADYEDIPGLKLYDLRTGQARQNPA
jgi:tRNA(fMet)-specific endonuclease VapC